MFKWEKREDKKKGNLKITLYRYGNFERVVVLKNTT